jgi:hypothetical protein
VVEHAYAFSFEGRPYRLATLLLSEANAIQRVTGKTLGQFEAALTMGDSMCLTALVWVARKRAEPTLKLREVDGDVMSFRPLCRMDDCGDDPERGGLCASHHQDTDDADEELPGLDGADDDLGDDAALPTVPRGAEGNGLAEPEAMPALQP